MSSSRFPCLLWLLIVALSIFLPIAAFPTALSTASVNSSSELLRRECVLDSSAPNGFNCDLNAPTLQQIINKIQDPAYGGKADDTHRACFYTNLGMGHHQWMVGWLKSRGLHHNYYWFSDSVDILWFATQYAWLDDNKVAIEAQYQDGLDPVGTFGNCFYEAMSLAAVHPTAFIFTPADEEPRPESVWIQIELPALTRNPKIQNIYRVDPRPASVKGISEAENCGKDNPVLIWKRGRDAEIIDGRTCPRI